MPTIQSAYPSTMAPAAMPGQIVDMRNRTVLSKLLATGTLAFGAPVVRSSAGDNNCVAVGGPGAGGFLGVALIDRTVPPVAVGTPDIYSAVNGTMIVAVLIRGIVWVTVTSSVTPGAAAYYDSAGNFTATAAGNTAVPNGVFESTATAGGFAKLRL